MAGTFACQQSGAAGVVLGCGFAGDEDGIRRPVWFDPFVTFGMRIFNAWWPHVLVLLMCCTYHDLIHWPNMVHNVDVVQDRGWMGGSEHVRV